MESDQPDGGWVRVDPTLPLGDIEFLGVEDATPDLTQYLLGCLRIKSSGQRPPGTPGLLWQTPKRPPPAPQEDLFSFGSATAVFDSLQSGQAHTVTYDGQGGAVHGAGVAHHPQPGPPLSIGPPAFIPGLPVTASPAQHIHINNFTANLNFPGHHAAPVTSMSGTSQGPSTLPSQPLPFTVGSHYPAPYVAPFPQPSPSPPVYTPTGGYPPSPMVVYQPPHLHLSMYPPPSPHYPAPPQPTLDKGHHRTSSSSSSNCIMFGSTPVVSVRHSSSDEEGEEQQQGGQVDQENRGDQQLRPAQPHKSEHQYRSEHPYRAEQSFRAEQPYRAEQPTKTEQPIITEQQGRARDTSTSKQFSHAQDLSSDQISSSSHRIPPTTPSVPPAPVETTTPPERLLQSLPPQFSPGPQPPFPPKEPQVQSLAATIPAPGVTGGDPVPPTPPSSDSPTPAKSWASLFNQSPGSLAPGILCPGEKPTARIPPFTPTSGPPSTCSPSERELGSFLRGYNLNHIAPAFLPRGLTNRSNWCFVNAILQALLACPPFYNLMKSLPCTGPGLRTGKSSTPMIDSVVEFINEFTPLETMSKTMKKDKARKKEDLPTGNPFEPSYVYRTLLQIESETFRCVEGRQEDAEEFLSCLLNMISDEMLALLKLTEPEVEQQRPRPEDGGQEWLEVGARGRSCVTRRIADQNGLETPVQQLALGLYRYSVKAASKETSATLQPFFTLQLDIQHPSVTSVDQALAQNFAAEQLDGYICSKTGQEVEASKSLSLEDLPPILVLHLKRFVYDGTTGGCQKVMKAVEFSVDLEIPRDILSVGSKSKYTTKQRQYKLFGVVYHNGREATKGHYIADVYHTGYASWLRCDDSLVTPTVEQLVTAPSPTSVPYILFYRRGDTMVGVEKTVK